MRHLFQKLAEGYYGQGAVCLATIITKTGSAPQVPGSSAVFTAGGLIDGTLGGGILEATVEKAAMNALDKKVSLYLEYNLDEDIDAGEGAICGGKTGILIDAAPEEHIRVFRDLSSSLKNGTPGVLVTHMSPVKASGAVTLQRTWIPTGRDQPLPSPFGALDMKMVERYRLHEKLVFLDDKLQPGQAASMAGFILHPVFPVPRLIIAGAGHIGKAVAKLAADLDFNITVIDDRPENTSLQNLRGVDEIITGNFGHIISHLNINESTYIVIVTRGHAGDGEALGACINSPAAYIGMIGSRRKIELMRQKFLSKNRATAEQWEKIHAPIGMDIGSVTVNEIAVSIVAELIRERHQKKLENQCGRVWGLVLAAGESKRMGTPKMLLSFGESTIIETVLRKVSESHVNRIVMVVGSEKEAIIQKTKYLDPVICVNHNYRDGMFSSVLAGFRALPPDAEAVLVFLGDQPMVPTPVINDLIKTWKKTGKGIIIPTFENRRGHPVLIDANYRSFLESIDPGQGLRALMNTFPEDIFELHTEHSSVLRDIDTALDYQREITREK